jgi:hypothetical protein
MSRASVDDERSRGSAHLRQLPDQEALTQGLSSVLCANQSAADKLTIVDRARNLYASRFPSEVVTCRTADGRTIRILCKYGQPAGGADGHGHRGGVAYEASLYRTLLGPLGLSVPHCYGSYQNPNSNQTWLILEYLDRTLRVSHCVDPESAMASAAGWLGDFHARTEPWLRTRTPSLIRYDDEYYRGCAGRTLDFARAIGQMSPWLRALCEHPEGFIGPLVEAPQAVIHGEFYTQNILSHEGRIVPIDWETAAVAPGEIDLASLIERWPEVAHVCENEYRRSRWPLGSPPDLRRILAAARVYWQLRWLGDRPEWLEQDGTEWRLSELRAAGECLGVI